MSLPQICFSEGTLICTDAGEVPIESLKEGDMLLTLNGFKPVKWIARRKVDFQSLTDIDRELSLPVLIKASALGNAIPRQDTIVSACHSVVANGKLFPAGNLINGKTICALGDTRQINYFHLEFNDWELVLANGLQAESFVDVGNRVHFDNYTEWRAAQLAGQANLAAGVTA